MTELIFSPTGQCKSLKIFYYWKEYKQEIRQRKSEFYANYFNAFDKETRLERNEKDFSQN